MARKLRVEYPGAIYHVMNRGGRREPILHADADRQRFVETFAEVCAKTGWQVHGRRGVCRQRLPQRGSRTCNHQLNSEKWFREVP